MTNFETIKEVIFNMTTKGLSDEAAKRVSEARYKAINALEKQFPKKIVVSDKNIYLCPNCGANAETDCGDDMLDYRLNYCDNCGQKLDWSEL